MLRKSPTRTEAFLAANRRNAQKGTGPRTPEGKARVSLNALKNGRYAHRLPESLEAAGYRSAAAPTPKFGRRSSPPSRRRTRWR